MPSRLGGQREIERVAAGGLFAFGDLGAEHAVIVGMAGERGKDLLAVDDPAALDRLRLGAERDAAGRGRAAFRERLRIDRAVVDDALVVHGAPLLVLGRGWRRPCRGRRPAGRTTASSRHACSRSARWRRNSGRSRRRPAHRSGSRRRGRHAFSGWRCRAGRRGAGRGNSRSGISLRDRRSAARPANTAWPSWRARAMIPACSSLRRNARGSKIGASRTIPSIAAALLLTCTVIMPSLGLQLHGPSGIDPARR